MRIDIPTTRILGLMTQYIKSTGQDIENAAQYACNVYGLDCETCTTKREPGLHKLVFREKGNHEVASLYYREKDNVLRGLPCLANVQAIICAAQDAEAEHSTDQDWADRVYPLIAKLLNCRLENSDDGSMCMVHEDSGFEVAERAKSNEEDNSIASFILSLLKDTNG